MIDIASKRAALGIAPKGEGPDSTARMQHVIMDRLNIAESECARLMAELAVAKAELQACQIKCDAACEKAEEYESEAEEAKAECATLTTALAEAKVAQARAEERAIAAEQAKTQAMETLGAERSRPLPALLAPPAEPAAPVQVVKAWLLETRDAQGNPRRLRMTPEY